MYTVTPTPKWCAPTISTTVPAVVGEVALTSFPTFSTPDSTRPKLDLVRLERALREAMVAWDGYAWPSIQNRELDAISQFVFAERRWWALDSHLVPYEQLPEYRKYLNYARARWLSTWSSLAVEQMFCASPLVVAERNRFHRLVDFRVGGTSFDLKLTGLPARYPGGATAAMQDPASLVRYLYRHQSTGSRYHMANRLFVILHSSDGKHTRLKAELTLIRRKVEEWLVEPRAMKVYLLGGQAVKSDVIWVEA